MTVEHSEPVIEFENNDKVEHPRWGLGVVMHRSGSGEKTKVVVQFYKEEKLKTLMVKYAKLKKIASGVPSPKTYHKPIMDETEDVPHQELEPIRHVEHLEGLHKEKESDDDETEDKEE